MVLTSSGHGHLTFLSACARIRQEFSLFERSDKGFLHVPGTKIRLCSAKERFGKITSKMEQDVSKAAPSRAAFLYGKMV